MIPINVHVNKVCNVVVDSINTFCSTVKIKPVSVDANTFIGYISDVDNKKIIFDDFLRISKYSTMWNLKGFRFAVLQKNYHLEHLIITE